MNTEIRNQLENMADKPYREFSSKLIPSKKTMLGIRTPQLRTYAKELALSGEDIYYEEVMLRGMIIGYLKVPAEKRLKLITDFIPAIDNWGVCDSFCCTLKFTNRHREQVWDLIQSYAASEKEFEQRFAAVMILDYFIHTDYLSRSLEVLQHINTEHYYSSMAVAWTAAECYIKFPDDTLPYLTGNVFDRATHNRAIRKICDSYRVEKCQKEALKKLVRKER